MKNQCFILIIIGIILNVNIAYSQTNYYPGSTGTITKDGYVYKYDTKFGWIRLYNIKNIYPDVKWGYKDGSKMTEDVFFGRTPTIDTENDNWTRQRAFSIVNNAFTTQQKALIKGHSVIINLYLDPLTGKVVDVYFLFIDNSPYRNIPPETFRTIEVEMKKQLYFTMTDVGKKLHYGLRCWAQEPWVTD